MLCYVMLCYVMLCYVILCFVMFCYVMFLAFVTYMHFSRVSISFPHPRAHLRIICEYCGYLIEEDKWKYFSIVLFKKNK